MRLAWLVLMMVRQADELMKNTLPAAAGSRKRNMEVAKASLSVPHHLSRAGLGPTALPAFLAKGNIDLRPSPVAPRAGTRGFRAPEVLLRCQDQTVGAYLAVSVC